MRAFIFSLDAFIAFTLALIAIYSLIFFSSIPSSYYFLLTQGHYLARDSLLTLSTASCSSIGSTCLNRDISVLDNIANAPEGDLTARNLVIAAVGQMIPEQFGYNLEISEDNGASWRSVYDTASSDPRDNHARAKKKLTVSSQVLSFGYSDRISISSRSPFRYLSCDGAGGEGYLLTCGNSQNSPPGLGRGDLIPKINARIVRLTVFI